MEPFFQNLWTDNPDGGRILDSTWDSPMGTNWSSPD